MKGLGEHSLHRHELGGVDQWPTQVIPAGKQRGLLRIYLKNKDGVCQRQSFLVNYVPFCMIVRHDHMEQKHELLKKKENKETRRKSSQNHYLILSIYFMHAPLRRQEICVRD